MFFYIYIICLNENAVSEFINYSSKMCLHSSQQSVKMLNSLLEKQFWKRGHQLTFAQMWFFFFFFFWSFAFPRKGTVCPVPAFSLTNVSHLFILCYCDCFVCRWQTDNLQLHCELCLAAFLSLSWTATQMITRGRVCWRYLNKIQCRYIRCCVWMLFVGVKTAYPWGFRTQPFVSSMLRFLSQLISI